MVEMYSDGMKNYELKRIHPWRHGTCIAIADR